VNLICSLTVNDGRAEINLCDSGRRVCADKQRGKDATGECCADPLVPRYTFFIGVTHGSILLMALIVSHETRLSIQRALQAVSSKLLYVTSLA
jgi:hypothetical protein